ncbi:hypothetical protein [Nostoc sp. 106C]|uniref:hypothetical protein n=1 Tax=Nostoc sp. 106C TaxID=1932667 RepID=UPI001FB69312|nr:hypothetical protein [Nostoc sp. 106C]
MGRTRRLPFPLHKRTAWHGMKFQQAWVNDAEVICQGQLLKCDRFFKVRLQTESVTN